MSHHGAPVVVAVKDKQRSALRFGRHTAQRAHRGMRVVHATGLNRAPAHRYLGPDLTRELRREGHLVLQEARDDVDDEPSEVDVVYALAAGPVARALESESERAAMLVIGTDDLTRSDWWLGGSVASRLALHADSPVVVVPENDEAWQHAGGIVVALDAETPARGPLRFAFEQASESGSRLRVLHALPRDADRAEAELLRVDVLEILAGWRPDHPDVEVTLHLSSEPPDAACLEASEQAQLVVVGRPHRHVSRPHAGRPLEARVIDRAHCPVAVVPADYEGR